MARNDDLMLICLDYALLGLTMKGRHPFLQMAIDNIMGNEPQIDPRMMMMGGPPPGMM